MRAHLLLSAALLASAYTSYTPEHVMVDVTNEFGACVLKLVATRTENVAFSPYGLVSVALVLYEGTSGPTAAEIHNTLRLPWDRQVTRIGFRDLHRYLKSYFTNDGFLRGLVLSKPDVLLNKNYTTQLQFYGFDFKSESPTKPPLPAPQPPGSGTTLAPFTLAPTTIRSTSRTTLVTTAETTIRTTTGKTPQETTIALTTLETTKPDVTTIMTTEKEVESKDMDENLPEAPSETTKQPATEGITAKTTNHNGLGEEDSKTTASMTVATENMNPTQELTTELVPQTEPPTTSVQTTLATKIEPSSEVTTAPTTMTPAPPQTTSSSLSPTTTPQAPPTTTPPPTTTNPSPPPPTNPPPLPTTTNPPPPPTNPPPPPTTTNPPPPPTNPPPPPTTTNPPPPPTTTNPPPPTTNSPPPPTTTTPPPPPTTTNPPPPPTTSPAPPPTTTNSPIGTTISNTEPLTTTPSSEASPETASLPPPPSEDPSATTSEGSTQVPAVAETDNVASESEQITRLERALYHKGYDGERREGIPNWVPQYQDPRWSYHAPLENWFFTPSGGERVPIITYTAYLPFAHIQELSALALQLPLDDPRYFMVVLLPEEREGLGKLLYGLQWCPLRGIVNQLKTTAVYATIPSFTIVKHINLVPALTKLGIVRAFDSLRADLTPMSSEPGLYVRTVEQVVTVSLRKYFANHRWFDATPGDVEQHFIANHPFAYFVLDRETQVALMTGTIVNPVAHNQ